MSSSVEYRRKNPWTGHCYSAKSRCEYKKSHKYKRYGGRGIEFLLSTLEVKKLWFRDKAYNLKEPTIDRINNDGHYNLKNCRFIERELNTNLGKWKRIRQYTIDGKFIKEHQGVCFALKSLNKSSNNCCIARCARGEQKIACGFKWKYA